MRELQRQRLARVPHERDVDHRLGAVAGRLARTNSLRMGAMAVDGQVLAEEVDVVQRRRRGHQLGAHLALARAAR